jgi:hypothetical protein
MCGKCRKKLQPGDRTGANPNNIVLLGAWLSEEFELTHIDCKDPDLSKGMLT